MSTIEFNNQLIGLKGPLEYFAYHLTMNDEEAKDLLQETYLKAISYRDKFRDKTNLKAWLYTIMKNTFINQYRRAAKTKKIMDQNRDLTDFGVAQRDKPENQESKYQFQEITREVEALDQAYRVPFQMYNDGFKYKEIAAEMELPIGTVKSRIFLARKQLMSKLEDYSA